MIHIHERLWYVIDDKREDNLAYMCQYIETESGDVAANVKKMQQTGRSWANKKIDDSGNIVDNNPTKDMYVGCSVSRWSTSNKLFRVQDPRGFTVEIPTDNLATLLHHTTVIKGVIQEECVWGREGNNHILLPVNSEPYLDAKKDQDTLENKLIPVSDLKVGDWVEFFGAGNLCEYYFVGRVKITWKIRGHRYGRYDYWNSTKRKEENTDWYEIEDDKYVNFFLRYYPDHKETNYYAEMLNKPKITKVLRNEPIEYDLQNVGWLHSPERVNNKLDDLIDTSYYDRVQSKILSIKHKGE